MERMMPELPKWCRRLIFEVCWSAREEGIPVSTFDIEEVMSVLSTYCILKGKVDSKKMLLSPSIQDVERIIKSCIAKRREHEVILDKILESKTLFRSKGGLMREIENAVKTLGLHYNSKIKSITKLVESGSEADKRVKREKLSTLMKLGLIRRTRQGYRVLSRREVERLVREVSLRGKPLSAREAANMEFKRRILSAEHFKIENSFFLLENTMLSPKEIECIDIRRLFSLIQYSEKAGNKELTCNLIRGLAKRIASASGDLGDLGKYSGIELVKYMKKYDALTDGVLSGLLLHYPGSLSYMLKNGIIDRDKIIEVFKNMPWEGQKNLLKHACNHGMLRPLVKDMLLHCSPLALSDIRIREDLEIYGEERKLLEAASRMAKAMKYACMSAEGDRDFIEMAAWEARKAEKIFSNLSKIGGTLGNKLYRDYRMLRTLVLVAIGEGSETLDTMVRLHYLKDPVSIIIPLRSIYRSAVNPGVRMKALLLATKLTNIIRRRLRSSMISGYKRKHSSIRKGRLSLRKTLFKYSRLTTSFPVYESKELTDRFVIIVDVSGSMRKYVEWSIIMASAFYKYIDSLILFREDVKVVTSRIIRSLRALMELLFQIDYAGWTNISLALNEGLLIARKRGAGIILISDLKQTIDYTPPEEIFRKIKTNRVRTIVLTPPNHNRILEVRLKEMGIPVLTISEPSSLPRVIIRCLRSPQ